MIDQISINGSPTEFESLSVSLPAGTGGPTASLSFVAGFHLIPQKGDKIEFSIGGLTWNKGICDSNPATYEGKTKVVSVSVLGVQHMLDRKVTYEGGPAPLSEILTELFTGSGVAAGILGTEPEDAIFFPFEGKLLDAVEQIQTRTGGFLAWITPDGDFYLINPDDGHTAHELPWTGGTGYLLGQLQDLSGLQKTRFRVTGRNPKANLGGPDSLDYSQAYGGDGVSTKFEYDPRVTEVVAVYVDATQQSFVPEGSAQQGTVDCYNSIEQSAVIFNTAPAEGAAITIEGVIDQATAELDDTTEQTALAASFGGDGVRLIEESHPELITQADCDAYAEGMKLRYGKKMRELTAEVWADVAIYLPSNKVVANDGLGFSATLPVQTCTATREGGKWIQQVTIGDGPPGGQTTPGQGFKRIAQRLRKASLPPQPPAPTRTIEYSAPPRLATPQGIAFDSLGNAYIADTGNVRIRKVSSGILSTYAGTGTGYISGDGGPAIEAEIYTISSLAVDVDNNLYLLAPLSHRVRVVDFTTKIINAFAGNGTEGDAGNGGPAVDAELHNDNAISIKDGNLYISQLQFGMKYVDISSGTIDEFFSSHICASSAWDGDTLYFVSEDSSSGGSFVKKRDSGGTVTVFAGQIGVDGYSGDGGPAVDAALDFSSGFGGQVGLAVDGDGNLYIADIGNHAIRKVDTSGNILTIAGNGTAGYSGDGGAASTARLNNPSGLCIHNGYLYVCDASNFVIRRINLTTGIITLFAGTPGQSGFSGDGGPATL